MTNSHALFSLLILLVCVTTFTKTWGGRVKDENESYKPHLHPSLHTRQILNLGEAVVFIK